MSAGVAGKKNPNQTKKPSNKYDQIMQEVEQTHQEPGALPHLRNGYLIHSKQCGLTLLCPSVIQAIVAHAQRNSSCCVAVEESLLGQRPDHDPHSGK